MNIGLVKSTCYGDNYVLPPKQSESRYRLRSQLTTLLKQFQFNTISEISIYMNAEAERVGAYKEHLSSV